MYFLVGYTCFNVNVSDPSFIIIIPDFLLHIQRRENKINVHRRNIR